ncbi:MAG TPA: SDR family oxidoreductase [Candidatus Saccharimonadales bacterium]|nr:SDR family oxidoreductase [Candidatus Saccharimonadales bacterium]
MTNYTNLLSELKQTPRTWLITGAAGFIGSNLMEALLKTDQKVVGLDNFSTGKEINLQEALNAVTPKQRENFKFIKGDIRVLADCQKASEGVDYVLHHAALGSVPLSVENPLGCNENNVTGCLNMLLAARDQKVRRFVYASSSAVYGDCEDTLKVEDRVGQSISPYAASKSANELYASVFSKIFGLGTVGLRYFNVFGPRQDPNGAYAAVLPRWVTAMITRQPVSINGDGSTSRDFLYVANVVQANMLAATTDNPAAIGQVFNVALSTRTTLNELFEVIRGKLLPGNSHLENFRPLFQDFRAGDILHSQADISKAKKLLNYHPSHTLEQGLDAALEWYKNNLCQPTAAPAGSLQKEPLATHGLSRPAVTMARA